MRVLHLPVNISSQTQITVQAMRDFGIQARGLVANPALVQSSESLERYYDTQPFPRRYSLRWFRYHVAAVTRVLAAIKWADVVHYHYGGAHALPFKLDLFWTCALNKPRLINFWGSDIRIPEIERRDNPYYARRDRTYERWAGQSYEQSRRLQTYYARHGFGCVISSETMLAHVQTDLFPTFHFVRGSVNLSKMQPRYPDPSRQRVVIAHSPSDPVVKGTSSVLAAVGTLRSKRGLDFDFVLIQNTPRQEALEILRGADIYLDQFVISGYGMAAIEAMALGKVVVSYIAPSVASQYPSDLPIVNATQDNLAEVLEELLKDGNRREELAKQGRAYVEKYHDARQNVRQLVSIYESLLIHH